MRLAAAICILCPITMASFQARADGLADLKDALARLQGQTAVAAKLTHSVTDIRDPDDEDDRRVRTGSIDIQVSDNAQGLQLAYPAELLVKVEQEAAERLVDENAETPTRLAVGEISTIEVRGILSAAASIQRDIQHGTFLHETAVKRDGQALRLLTFELPVQLLISDKQTRKYVKKFESRYEVLIDADGTPLETNLSYEGSGRAYIILRLEASGSEYSTYQRVGDRLVRTYTKDENGYSSTFGSGSFAEEQTLTLLPAISLGAIAGN